MSAPVAHVTQYSQRLHVTVVKMEAALNGCKSEAVKRSVNRRLKQRSPRLPTAFRHRVCFVSPGADEQRRPAEAV